MGNISRGMTNTMVTKCVIAQEIHGVGHVSAIMQFIHCGFPASQPPKSKTGGDQDQEANENPLSARRIKFHRAFAGGRTPYYHALVRMGHVEGNDPKLNTARDFCPSDPIKEIGWSLRPRSDTPLIKEFGVAIYELLAVSESHGCEECKGVETRIAI